ISSTVDDAQAAGTTVQAQSVAGRDGFLLSDKQDVSFVVADDVRTYVITLSHGVVAKPAERVVLLDMAHHLLGIPPSTSAATATACTRRMIMFSWQFPTPPPVHAWWGDSSPRGAAHGGVRWP